MIFYATTQFFVDFFPLYKFASAWVTIFPIGKSGLYSATPSVKVDLI